jgi:hypothetical protein
MSRMNTIASNIYQDLEGHKWDLQSLNAAERRLVRSALREAQKGVDWAELTNSWRQKLLRLHRGRSGKELVRLPVYAICEDIVSRLGIEQGYFRQRDYRDDLQEIIEESFPSRYRFAKSAGLDEAFLSRVIHKHAHLSIDSLDQAVASLGYRVALVPAELAKGRTRSASSKGRQLR